MKYSQCLDYIRSDYYRISGRSNDSLMRMWLATWLDVGFRFMFWLRFSKCNNVLLCGGSRLMHRWLMMRHHIIVERQTDIGYGFYIVHGGPVVINCSAKIGDNVNIYQYSTIGSSYLHAAEIGDEVYIGPSVCIVEDVKIGNGATIGAGAVVVKNVEAGATVGGNPAHVISHNEPGRLIIHKWKREWNAK